MQFASCHMPFARNMVPKADKKSIIEKVDFSDNSGSAGIRYPGVGRMFLVWTAIGALTVVRSQLFSGAPGHSRETFSYILACTSWYFPWAVLSIAVFRLEQRFPLGTPGWPTRLAVLAAISVPFCLAASPLMMAFDSAIRYALDSPHAHLVSFRFWIALFPSAEGIFWCSVAGGYFLRTLFELHEQQRRSAQLALEKSELEASLNQAQLEALRARLNPHFLFNSLQNISVLAKQDHHTASRMLTVLGDLLRAVLRRDSEPECPLNEEIELTQSYVALEQMRFADRLRVTFDIPGKVSQALVPCFLMQPLLENAIKHGLRGVRKAGIISVRVTADDCRLTISVADNGVGPPKDADSMTIGIGLGSTCERLAKMYREHHQFSIQPLAEGGTEVRIVIPLRFATPTGHSFAHERLSTINR